MRFLVDAQLPPRLVPWFVGRGHDARHVGSMADGLRMPDVEIWRHALAAGEIIVSKDRDFLDLAAVRGSPPVLLLIALGNTSTDSLLHALERAWPQIVLELARPEAGVVTLEPERLVVLHR